MIVPIVSKKSLSMMEKVTSTVATTPSRATTPKSSRPKVEKSGHCTTAVGSVAAPGFTGVTPGKGVIRMPPVSVCHHVSTTAQRPSPTTSWYHFQISGLIGSPTLPSTRNDVRRWPVTHRSPAFAIARSAVGAV